MFQLVQSWVVRTDGQPAAPYDARFDELGRRLPKYKSLIRDFLEAASDIKTIFVQIDNFHLLPHYEQPMIADFINRLCRDLPVYFKLATDRDRSVLYAVRDGRSIGIQQGHDYLAIDLAQKNKAGSPAN